MLENPEALKKMRDEWNGLTEQGTFRTWDCQEPRRKFKGRAVLLGNKVTNQNIEATFFQDLGNSPATFEAARWADLYGLLPKKSVMLADAIRAELIFKLTLKVRGSLLNYHQSHGRHGSSFKIIEDLLSGCAKPFMDIQIQEACRNNIATKQPRKYRVCSRRS